jgi:hypothetical protein
MPRLTDRAWSPYLAGALIGLLQVPAFLLLGTALGASSSYVTVSAALGSLLDPTIAAIDYAAKHLEGAKNWWQVALVGGIAPRRLYLFKAFRHPPLLAFADLGAGDRDGEAAAAFPDGLRGRLSDAAWRAHR